MQKIPSLKRKFYFVMGGLSLFTASAILTRVLTEFSRTGTTSYGTHIPFPHPILQWVHIIAGLGLWIAAAILGGVWLWRACKGYERPEVA